MYFCQGIKYKNMKQNRIKEVLDEKGISQTWLVKKLDKSFNSVNSYICNRTQPNLETQPRHIQEMLVSVPDDWELAKDMIEAGNKFIQAMESMSKADFEIRENGFDKMCNTECPCSE